VLQSDLAEFRGWRIFMQIRQRIFKFFTVEICRLFFTAFWNFWRITRLSATDHRWVINTQTGPVFLAHPVYDSYNYRIRCNIHVVIESAAKMLSYGLYHPIVSFPLDLSDICWHIFVGLLIWYVQFHGELEKIIRPSWAWLQIPSVFQSSTLLMLCCDNNFHISACGTF